MGAHAELGPSSAHRWVHCPGSVALVAKAPPDEGGAAATAGQANHALADHVLRGGSMAKKIEHEGYVYTVDDRTNVSTYLAALMPYTTDPNWYEAERLIPLPFVEDGCFGTIDFTHFDPKTGILTVIDYKSGATPVYAKGNHQLRLYGLGVLLAIELVERVTGVRLGIMQPLSSPDIHWEEWDDVDAFRALAEFYHQHALEARAPDAPLVVGSQCKWCPARSICPLQYAIGASDMALMPPVQPLVLHELEDTDLAVLFRSLKAFEAWADKIKAEVRTRLELGASIPGCTLMGKPNPTKREWVNDAAIQWIATSFPPEIGIKLVRPV